MNNQHPLINYTQPHNHYDHHDHHNHHYHYNHHDQYDYHNDYNQYNCIINNKNIYICINYIYIYI
jgi:hypothetical protein